MLNLGGRRDGHPTPECGRKDGSEASEQIDSNPRKWALTEDTIQGDFLKETIPLIFENVHSTNGRFRIFFCFINGGQGRETVQGLRRLACCKPHSELVPKHHQA